MHATFASSRQQASRRRLTSVAVCTAAVVVAFVTAQLTASAAYGARMDSCTAAESASTNTVMTKTTN